MTKREDVRTYSADEIANMQTRGEDRTDWDRVDNLTEAELEASIDQKEEGEFDWSNVQVALPTPKKQITVRFDQDVVEWFRSQGSGYQTRMNQVLRSYVEAHRRK
jgi:uncharacterized protein (DUF4415 family)